MMLWTKIEESLVRMILIKTIASRCFGRGFLVHIPQTKEKSVFRTPTVLIPTGNWRLAVTCLNKHKTYKDTMHPNAPYQCGECGIKLV